MKIYNKYLKQVERILGKGETSSYELNKLCSRLFGNRFAGVYACNQIPKLNNIIDMCILNTDPSYMSGEHWVSVIFKDGVIYVYDSFGRKTKKILPSLFKHYKYIKETEDDTEQKKIQSNCGQRCVASLLVYENYGLKDFLKI